MDTEKRYSLIYRNAILVALLGLSLWIIYLCRSIFFPLILSVILAYILNPLILYLEKGGIWTLKRKFSRIVSIFIAFFILILFLTVLIIWIAQPMNDQINILSRKLPSYIKNIQDIVQDFHHFRLKDTLPESWNKVLIKEIEATASSLLQLVRKTLQRTFALFSHLLELFFVPILAFYFLYDKENIRKGIFQAIPVKYHNEAEKIWEETNLVLDRYVRGQLLLCAIMAVAAIIIFYLLKIEFALICGLFAGITKAIPLVGPIIGAVPAVIMAFLHPQPIRCVFLVISFFSLVQFLENKIILPKVMEYYVKLHPVTIIIALLIGGELWGVLGMFIAVPIAAILKIFYQHFYLKNLT